MSVYNLKTEMNNASYTDVATSVGIRTLVKAGLVKTFMQDDQWNNGQSYHAAQLTEKGEEWIMNNQDQLVFRKEVKKPTNGQQPIDDLPF